MGQALERLTFEFFFLGFWLPKTLIICVLIKNNMNGFS